MIICKSKVKDEKQVHVTNLIQNLVKNNISETFNKKA